ncbi:hypothetical protein [Mycoplasma phocimorsus]|uniref:hypothetical protein n=1 Tax=Mycoplasma phocimorsus TaxID=3045839 RepID=UPI0024C00DFA|nr:hypothetical protein [Mycoplasma phocimorsus]MDJ1646242.1 hypothetical protein [Mycoplasma phocimorsus]
MNNKKKLLFNFLASTSFISTAITIGCANKVEKSIQISRKFSKNKVRNENRENLLLNTNENKKYISDIHVINKAIKLQLNSINKEKFQWGESTDNAIKQASYRWEEENENNLNSKKLELLNAKKKQLEKAWAKQKELKAKRKRLNNIIIAVSIGGAIAAGFSAGFGAYFGLKNINSEINKEVEEIKNNIFLNENILKQIEEKDSLFEVFRNLLEVSFKKKLPEAIFHIIDNVILKTLLKDYVTEQSSKELEKIIKNGFKEKVTKIVEKILNDLSSINSFNDDYSIIKQVQIKTAAILKEYLPSFVRETLLFLTKTDNTSNEKRYSISALLLKALLEKNMIEIEEKMMLNISNLLEFYTKKISNDNNELMNFIIEVFVQVVESNNISFNILNDIYDLINKFIQKLLTKDDPNKIDFELIFLTLVPKLLEEIKKIDDSKNESKILEFINGLFECNDKEHNKKLIYLLIENKFDTKKIVAPIYLNSKLLTTNNIEQKQAGNIRKINFPHIAINIKTIISIFFNISNGINLVEQLLSIFIKPLIKLLNDSNKKEEAKKALFRISIFFAYLYYSYAPNTGIFDNIIKFFNPIEPIKMLKKLIESEIKKSGLELKDIWGPIESGFISSSYESFELAKSAAREIDANTEKEKFIEKLKSGSWSKSNSK